jgi:hypothetical protein
MTTTTPDQIAEVLRLHASWCGDQGVRADMHWETLPPSERQRFRTMAAKHEDGACELAFRFRKVGAP